MENEQLPKPPSPAEVFRQWADKIEKNDAEDFAGVFVAITPTGEVVSSLLIDKHKDVGTFFALLKSKIDDAITAANEQSKRGMGFR